MSVEEAGELARRAIYGATFRDAASGGCVSGMFLSTSSCLFSFCGIFITIVILARDIRYFYLAIMPVARINI